MFTIVRFTAEPGIEDQLAAIGASMNLVRTGVYSGLRRRGDGFSCDICAARGWDAHVLEIDRFVDEFWDAIKEAIRVGASVTVDVAIEPEDRILAGPVFVLGCSPNLLAKLVSAGLRMELSVY